MVSLLEPFIDTLIICTLTGLVILSSGVWKEKFDNEFQAFDTEFIAGVYTDDNPADVRNAVRAPARQHAVCGGSQAGPSRWLMVASPTWNSLILHNRSVAEDVRFLADGELYNGPIIVADGALVGDISMHGKSLLHSVPLTAEAFKKSFLGHYGQYAVTLGLVLFAFSTAVAWSYYGDRAITYLFGGSTVAVLPFRLFYVAAFFLATVVDTSLVWLVSAVTLALMALPNLLGIVLLAKEMKGTVRDYWRSVDF